MSFKDLLDAKNIGLREAEFKKFVEELKTKFAAAYAKEFTKASSVSLFWDKDITELERKALGDAFDGFKVNTYIDTDQYGRGGGTAGSISWDATMPKSAVANKSASATCASTASPFVKVNANGKFTYIGKTVVVTGYPGKPDLWAITINHSNAKYISSGLAKDVDPSIYKLFGVQYDNAKEGRAYLEGSRLWFGACQRIISQDISDQERVEIADALARLPVQSGHLLLRMFEDTTAWYRRDVKTGAMSGKAFTEYLRLRTIYPNLDSWAVGCDTPGCWPIDWDTTDSVCIFAPSNDKYGLHVWAINSGSMAGILSEIADVKARFAKKHVAAAAHDDALQTDDMQPGSVPVSATSVPHGVATGKTAAMQVDTKQPAVKVTTGLPVAAATVPIAAYRDLPVASITDIAGVKLFQKELALLCAAVNGAIDCGAQVSDHSPLVKLPPLHWRSVLDVIANISGWRVVEQYRGASYDVTHTEVGTRAYGKKIEDYYRSLRNDGYRSD